MRLIDQWVELVDHLEDLQCGANLSHYETCRLVGGAGRSPGRLAMWS